MYKKQQRRLQPQFVSTQRVAVVILCHTTIASSRKAVVRAVSACTQRIEEDQVYVLEYGPGFRPHFSSPSDLELVLEESDLHTVQYLYRRATSPAAALQQVCAAHLEPYSHVLLVDASSSASSITPDTIFTLLKANLDKNVGNGVCAYYDVSSSKSGKSSSSRCMGLGVLQRRQRRSIGKVTPLVATTAVQAKLLDQNPGLPLWPQTTLLRHVRAGKSPCCCLIGMHRSNSPCPAPRSALSDDGVTIASSICQD